MAKKSFRGWMQRLKEQGIIRARYKNGVFVHMSPITYGILIFSLTVFVGSAALYIIKKSEQAAVMENELQEANDYEKNAAQQLEIANRPDDDADALLRRMREPN